jgi:hypothetical protein
MDAAGSVCRRVASGDLQRDDDVFSQCGLAGHGAQGKLRDERRGIAGQRELCLRDMRRALQQVKFVDAQGNEVRAKHALRIMGEQMVLPLIVYVDPRTAKPDLMHEAFKQNLDAIKNDVRRHAIEKHSYDLNNIYNATLPLFDYDFNQVAEDAMMTREYDDTYEPDDIPDPEPTEK